MDTFNKKRAKQTIKEMMEQRGHDILKYDQKLSDTDTEYFLVKKNNGENMYIFFTNIEKFNSEYVKFYNNELKKLETKHCMIIYINTITSSAKKQLVNIPIVKEKIKLNTKIEYMYIEMFRYDELLFNITKHKLQPESFKQLNTKESQKFKKSYGTKIPVLLKSDPVCKFYNFETGSIIEITRKNGYITHRIVKNLKK